MNKTLQSTALSIIGVISMVAAVGGLHLNFVKPVMRWPIIAAAVVLVVIAVLGMVGHDRGWGRASAHAPGDVHGAEQDDAENHDHGHGPRIGWLLLLPFLLLGIVAPGPLGAFSAERDSGRITTNGDVPLFDPIASSDAGASMALGEYSMRALYDDPRNLDGATFALTGFASKLASGDGWALTRMSVSCCAGDAQAIKVRVLEAPSPADDQWVTVVGRWTKSTGAVDDPATLPVIEATEVSNVTMPTNPYE